MSNSIAQIFDNIDFILVGTTLSANVGAAARAIKTMGFNQLILVNPKCSLDHHAHATAAGAAQLIDDIKIYSTLSDALNSHTLSIALSARTRSLPNPLVQLDQACQIALAHCNLTAHHQTTRSRIAFVFGRENSGLTNTELGLTNIHASIPADHAYGVLNLAAAVQVTAYQLRMCAMDRENKPTQNADDQTANQLDYYFRVEWDEPPASHEQMRQLESLLIKLLYRLNIIDTKNPRKTPERLKRLVNRMQLDATEYNLIRATLARLLK